MAISEKIIDELEYELLNLREVMDVRNQTIDGLINMNDKLAKENAALKRYRAADKKGWVRLHEENSNLTKENAELKRQIEVFTKAEIWGDDAAKYEGEYNG